jgi:tetratricopeptide (TPR) repeat protein
MEGLESVENIEAFSLFGEPLYRAPITLWLPSEKEAYERKLREHVGNYEKALKEYLEDPDDPEKIVWLGRRAGILGNFNEAAAIFSMGIEKYPDDPRFYRFRGHRFVILRRIDLAIADFERAASLIEGREDEPEHYVSGSRKDGKIGVMSFNWNVWYHQGFTYFVAGRLHEAAEAYRRCLGAIDHPEGLYSTAHWLYMVLIRLGLQEEADDLLERIPVGAEIIEVHDYYDTLMMYKGEMTPEELLERARAEGPARLPTRGQAVANYYMAKGMTERAVEVYREVLGTGVWTAGVYALSEAELLRLGERP